MTNNQAVKESLTPAPAWHDAPTVPGVWLAGASGVLRRLDAHDVAHLAKDPVSPRWYGPIPADDGGTP